MEATLSGIEDVLVKQLDYKLKVGASYITSRRNVSYFSQGGNEYAPNGFKILKFSLASGWLDPSSVRIMYTLTNTDGNIQHQLRPIGDPSCFFKRLRIIGNHSTILEDIDGFDRFSHMMNILSTDEHSKNEYIEGFGWKPLEDGESIFKEDEERGLWGGNIQNYSAISSILRHTESAIIYSIKIHAVDF